MTQEHDTQKLVRPEENKMLLFCLVKDVYQRINPWPQRYKFLKLLAGSEALAPSSFYRSCASFGAS